MISYTTELSLHMNLIKLYLLCCSGGRVPGQAVRVREEETPDRERVQKPRHSGKTGVSPTPEMLEI